MSRSKQTDPQLRSLADRLLNGQMSDDEMTSLDEILRDNPSAQEYVLDICQFHAALTFQVHAEQAVNRLRPKVEKPSSKVSASHARHEGKGIRPPTFMMAAVMALAASLLLAVGIPFLVANKDQPGATWPEVNSIKIASGSTELQLADLGTVMLEGPAEFEMLGPRRARLHRGRIRVRLTNSTGHNFVVEIPNGQITDLGTEFGLDVPENGPNHLVVFDGAVDLRVKGSQAFSAEPYIERLVGGDAVLVNETGEVLRAMAVFTGRDAMFGQLADFSDQGISPVISNVSDNLRTGETRKFYAIVPQGLANNAKSYVDRRPYTWHAVDAAGMPPYLVGADYVQPFNNDKMRKSFELHVTLSCPARLFVIFDDRVPPPSWLTDSFVDTGDDIGMDLNDPRLNSNDGAGSLPPRPEGVLVDHVFSVWERRVAEAGQVTLGPNSGPTGLTAMYGIAAVALDAEPADADLALVDFGDLRGFASDLSIEQLIKLNRSP